MSDTMTKAERAYREDEMIDQIDNDKMSKVLDGARFFVEGIKFAKSGNLVVAFNLDRGIVEMTSFDLVSR